MKLNPSLSISPCARQAQMAERELSAFLTAVAERFGVVQARLSAEDWLDESQIRASHVHRMGKLGAR